ncbi:branched-chain amino acid ABC transporter permease [Pseudogemmatithrix spongiicola]|uniref:Branched-chain amino acid ABC transporter permease n=1 Tax=Pseudogemmatithrix spongiicola TaxID=3062599 RepID=A0AA49JTP1_9BACT|nr:branched-chain amino acid ABC transporter permease [Gemmatimonadaceae bacterium 'strain 138']WKW14630.1 branched-chain amino acid ABC transporter permease [Gemmatimonadaceae bacterium 'strain 318']
MSDLVQFLLAGLALGSVYALICLGFVVIYRATGVINFAQGGLVVLGAFLTHEFAVRQGLPFSLAVVLAVAAVAGIGMALERVVFRPMVGQPTFAMILITLGVLFVLEQASAARWGYDVLLIGDPWGVQTVQIGGATVKVADLWTLGAAGAALAALFALFRFSTLGIAMRAGAADPEAALAHGISPQAIHGLSWAIAGAVATLAGVFLSAGPKGVDLSLSLVAFRAFPAMILGGLDSPEGAVTGGVLIGLIEVLTAAYLVTAVPGVGANFHVVMPYLVMVVILIVRPYGLFGREEVRRA